VSDYFGLEDLLSPEDIALRKRVRAVMETHVAPIMTKVGFAKTCSLSSILSSPCLQALIARVIRIPVRKFAFKCLCVCIYIYISLCVCVCIPV